MLPGSPCDPGPHFPFLPSVLSTQEAWRGPPLAHPVCSRVDTGSWRHRPPPPPGLPLPVLCKTRRPRRGRGRRLWRRGGRARTGLLGRVSGRGYCRPACLSPHPFLLLLCFPKVQAALSKRQGDSGGLTQPYLVSTEQVWVWVLGERVPNHRDDHNNSGFRLLNARDTGPLSLKCKYL